MKQKTIDCLKFLRMTPGSTQRKEFFDAIVKEHSKKAIERKLKELADRGYIEHNENLNGGTLTAKGKLVLDTTNS